MKRLFTLLIAILTILTATAQVEHSIILDQNSFRAVQSDALTGVNIDKIGDDTSRKPCARVKIKFANMSRAEVDALDVKFQSNTDLVKRKVAEYYDNVLILEMTAKPNTRFYVKSPEFGESNEVTLNLEGYKEYEMEARLNQTYSIVVDSNVEGAEVYIDDKLKGRTDNNNSCTIKGVMIGSHTLKLVYGAISTEQQIEVHSGKISFRIEVNTAASEPQFVVFIVEPKSAVVTINNQPYSLNNGAMRVVLDPGTYNYSVAAASHHTQNGTFTVAGDKVTKQINLTADAATVTLTTPNGAEIWINEELKGTGRWSGTLTSGTYIFEARKQGHQSTRLSQRITSDTASQSYTLPAPTPIYGSIVVDGTPIAANVTIDGEHIGAMPLKVGNILVGTHTLRVSMAGYKEHVQTISIAEGKTTTVNPTLTKQQTSAPSSASGTYNIGDLVTVNGAQGVVFQTSPVVKIVSVKETTGTWSTEYETTGATDKDNGKANMDKIKSIAGWQTKYPAFKWCADYGNGWYLPALNELRAIYNQRDKINKTLSANNMDRLGSKEGSSWTWSSSEHNNYFMAYYIVFLYGSNNYVSKGNNFAVRAVYVIE